MFFFPFFFEKGFYYYHGYKLHNINLGLTLKKKKNWISILNCFKAFTMIRYPLQKDEKN